MTAYYNDNDPFVAEWLRNLIRDGLIAPGEVDERSIKEVQAEELHGFTQCHFFAGIGAWSYALRLAGWPDDRPVWTGSCPCPSFSASGKGLGFDDPRHLWPDWIRLIRVARPAVVFGEQVDDAIGFGWLDLVQTDLEAEEYALGKAVFGACSVGAPHIRQRLYFVAESQRGGRRAWSASASAGESGRALADDRGDSSAMADAASGLASDGGVQRSREYRLRPEDRGTGLVADAEYDGRRTDLSRRSSEEREVDGRPARAVADSGRDERRRRKRGPQEGTRENDLGRKRPVGDGGNGAVADAAGSRLFSGAQSGVSRDAETSRTRHAESEHGSDVGNAASRGRGVRGSSSRKAGRTARDGESHILVNSEREGPQRHAGNGDGNRGPDQAGPAAAASASRRVDHASGAGLQVRLELHREHEREGPRERCFWHDVLWIHCSDGKIRPVPPEPALFPLAARSAKRVGVLRGAGNSIVAPQAAEFIKAYVETQLRP